MTSCLSARSCLALAFSAAAAFAAPAPSTVLDLAGWKLTIPVGPARKPTEIPGADLVKGYTSDCFYVAPDGGVVFWAPVTGTTTATSHFPRSELREMKPNGSEFNWREADGVSVLSATCVVLQIPTQTGKTVIGQIHAKSINLPLLKLAYQKGEVVALVKSTSTSDVDTPYRLCEARLGERISYEVRLERNRLSVSANGHAVSVTIADDWEPVTLYFKAGNYVQANGGSSTDGGRVAFYALSVTHRPFAP